MEEIIAQVGNVGFPIVISVYLMVRFEKKIEILTGSIYKLNGNIEKLISNQKNN
ncbi:MAG TPA: YvrJ family protein [Defluviitaleaceae bacterium]|nr:YvrJ family protein [Candidatus Epulonipiscium sp.]HQD50850.1 YvrJ family protein [Defluviitaleaceae bacterium]